MTFKEWINYKKCFVKNFLKNRHNSKLVKCVNGLKGQCDLFIKILENKWYH
jgi:hypothetical protein